MLQTRKLRPRALGDSAEPGIPGASLLPHSASLLSSHHTMMSQPSKCVWGSMGIIYNPARAPPLVTGEKGRLASRPPNAGSVGTPCEWPASQPPCGLRSGHAFWVFLPKSFQGQRCACVCACACACMCTHVGEMGGCRAAGTAERGSSVLKLDALPLPAHLLHPLCPHSLPRGPAQPPCCTQSRPQGLCSRVCRCLECSSPRTGLPSLQRALGNCCDVEILTRGLGRGRVRISNSPCADAAGLRNTPE